MHRQRIVLIAGIMFSACAKEEAPVAPPPVVQAPEVKAEPAPEKVTGPRVVILGFDGVDPRRVEDLVQAGKLPNLEKLGAAGYRGAMRSTNPPQSPVAWAAFATGLPPGEHGIFDFVGRNPETYFPEIATTTMRHAEVNGEEITPATARNLRHGEAFWDVLQKRGVPSRALHVPYNFPLPEDGAKALAGLGAPDVRGINSSFTLLTTDAERAGGAPPAGGQIALLAPAENGGLRAMVEGPAIRVDGARQKTYAPVYVHPSGQKLLVDMGGDKQVLGVGETGAYVTLEFSPTPALRIKGVTRATIRPGPKPEIYLEPISIVPPEPYLSVAQPAPFARSIWKAHGPFKTVGWIDDTSAVGSGAMDDQQFLREAMATMRIEAQLLDAALNEHSDRVVIAVFTSPDRIGHMFYRHMDEAHPAKNGTPAPELVRALDEAYVEMDRIVGETQKKLAPEDVLLVMSDHGFASFRRGFNLNRWLVKNGYMTLKPGVTTPRDFFVDVDWQKTKAYGMGTGSIYLNLKGREAQGSVDPKDAARIAKAIAQKLTTTKDGKVKAVLAAYTGDEIYKGPQRENAPDVRVALAEGYRASWATSLGGTPAELFEDNTKAWSGDHASARPEDVPAVLVVNRPLKVQDPAIEDISASVYKAFNITPPEGTVGRALWD